MMRTIYCCLLLLHPPAFRRQFAGEMLWIFDESAGTAGAAPLMADGLASLARQWLVRYGTWKVAAAALGGLLYMLLGTYCITSSWWS